MAGMAKSAPARYAADLAVQISERNGAGEDSMNAFIHEHFSSILKPFNDRLDKFDDLVEGLVADLHKISSAQRTGAMQHQETEQLLNLLRMDVEKNKRELPVLDARCEAKFVEINRDKMAVNKDLQKRAEDFDALEAQHAATRDSVLALQQELAESNRTVSQLKAAFGEVASIVHGFDFSSVERINSQLQGLQSAHQGTLESLSRTDRFGKEAWDELQALITDCKFQWSKGEAKAKIFHEDLAKTTRKLQETEQLLQDVSSVKNAFNDILVLQNDVKQAQRTANAAFAFKQEVTGTCDALAASLLDVKAVLGIRDDGSKVERGLVDDLLNIKDQFGNLVRTCEHNAADIRAVRAGAERQSEEFRAINAYVAEIESLGKTTARRLEDIAPATGAAGDSILDFRSLGAKLQAEKVAREAVRTELQAQLDVQAQASGEWKAPMQKVEHAADASAQKLQSLEAKLLALDESLLSLRGGVDLTHEYWKGLTKGVQRTHRNIMVEAEAYAKKSPSGRTLPTLTPR